MISWLKRRKKDQQLREWIEMFKFYQRIIVILTGSSLFSISVKLWQFSLVSFLFCILIVVVIVEHHHDFISEHHPWKRFSSERIIVLLIAVTWINCELSFLFSLQPKFSSLFAPAYSTTQFSYKLLGAWLMSENNLKEPWNWRIRAFTNQQQQQCSSILSRFHTIYSATCVITTVKNGRDEKTSTSHFYEKVQLTSFNGGKKLRPERIINTWKLRKNKNCI